MTDKLYFPGQISVDRIDLMNYKGELIDIRAIVSETELFEDIFSNSMTGFMIVEDATGVFERFPIIGEEKLFVKLKTPTTDKIIEKKFYVYSVTKRQLNKQKRKQIYVLNFISYESIISQNVRISESFKGSITDNVVDIFLRKEYLGSDSPIFIDDTINQYKFIANYWTPFETINWLARRSISKDKTSNFLFFESNQSYEFVAASTLYKQDPVIDYVYSDVNSETAYGLGVDITQQLRFIRNVYQDSANDYLRSSQNGMLASQLNSLDMIFKRIESNNTNYIRDFKKYPHLESNPLFSESILSRKNASINFLIKNAARYGKNDSDQRHKDWYLQNSSQIEQLHTFRMIIEASGYTGVKAGSVIDFKMQKYDMFTSKEVSDIVNKTLSGKYLVTAIRHKIIADDHRMYIEISKESLKKKVGTE